MSSSSIKKTNFSIDAIMGLSNQEDDADTSSISSKSSDTGGNLLPTNNPTPNPTSATNSKRTRPKKYQCPYCWVALSNTGQFRGHIRIHTGERPYKCEQPFCQKTFTRNEELTRHRRIHTGQRPYACHLCNKCFGRKDHLKKHTRTHEKHINNNNNNLAAVEQQTGKLQSTPEQHIKIEPHLNSPVNNNNHHQEICSPISQPQNNLAASDENRHHTCTTTSSDANEKIFNLSRVAYDAQSYNHAYAQALYSQLAAAAASSFPAALLYDQSHILFSAYCATQQQQQQQQTESHQDCSSQASFGPRSTL